MPGKYPFTRIQCTKHRLLVHDCTRNKIRNQQGGIIVYYAKSVQRGYIREDLYQLYDIQRVRSNILEICM